MGGGARTVNAANAPAARGTVPDVSSLQTNSLNPSLGRRIRIAVALLLFCALARAGETGVPRWFRVKSVPLTGLAYASDAATWRESSFVVADRRQAEISVYDFDGNLLKKYAGHDRRNGGLYQPLKIATDGDRVYVTDVPATLHRYDRDLEPDGQWPAPLGRIATRFVVVVDRLWMPAAAEEYADGKRYLLFWFDRGRGAGFPEKPSGASLPAGAEDPAVYREAAGRRGVSLTPDGLLVLSWGAFYRVELVDQKGRTVLKIDKPPAGYKPMVNPLPPGGPENQSKWESWIRKWTVLDSAFPLGRKLIGVLRRDWEEGAWAYKLDVYDRGGRALSLGTPLPSKAHIVMFLRGDERRFQTLENSGKWSDRSVTNELVTYELR